MSVEEMELVKQMIAGRKTTAAKLAVMVLIVVAVDQFVQIICRFGMIGIDVRHFRIGLSVDPVVQQIDHGHTQRNRTDHHAESGIGFNGLCDQIEANHTQHHAACKTEQKTHLPIGIFL